MWARGQADPSRLLAGAVIRWGLATVAATAIVIMLLLVNYQQTVTNARLLRLATETARIREIEADRRVAVETHKVAVAAKKTETAVKKTEAKVSRLGTALAKQETANQQLRSLLARRMLGNPARAVAPTVVRVVRRKRGQTQRPAGGFAWRRQGSDWVGSGGGKTWRWHWTGDRWEGAWQ